MHGHGQSHRGAVSQCVEFFRGDAQRCCEFTVVGDAEGSGYMVECSGSELIDCPYHRLPSLRCDLPVAPVCGHRPAGSGPVVRIFRHLKYIMQSQRTICNSPRMCSPPAYDYIVH